MAHRTPGDIIHYQAFGSQLPLWPAVICTDDITPSSFLMSRPSGYVTIVLRLGDSLDLLWAQTTEMHDYNPMVPFEEEAMVASVPGLGEAYAVANSALEAGLGLWHWKSQLRRTVVEISSDEGDSDNEDPLEADFDRDLQKAIQMSLEEPVGTLKRTSTPPMPLSKRRKLQSNDQNDMGMSGLSLTGEGSNNFKRVSESSMTLEKIFPPSLILPDKEKSCKHLATRRKNQHKVIWKSGESSTTASNRVDRDLLSWDRLGKTSVPTSDTIEENLSASKQFVQVSVGPDKEKRLLHKNAVWDRPYFREPRTGVMFFELNDSGMWELNHPALADMEPEDFAFVAEYLESGAFGYKYPQDGKEIDEAFAQVVSAWTTAEQLGMTDLMDHIVEKLEGLQPWDFLNVLAFVCYVYASTGPPLPAQESLKDMLTTYIAEHYWIYVEDAHLSAMFIQRLKDFPELDRDICVRRTRSLDAHLNIEGDEEGEDADDDNSSINLD